MTESPVTYTLRYSTVEYFRRNGQMSSLMFSLAQQFLIWEAEGKAVEQVHCHLTGDNDYMGIALVDGVAGALAPAAEAPTQAA